MRLHERPGQVPRRLPAATRGLALQNFLRLLWHHLAAGRLCRSQSPWHGRSVASIPSWDKIPFLSLAESSMTRLESYPTIGLWLTSGVVSLLSPSPHPPDLTSHPSSAIRHPPSDICHSPFRLSHSPFRIPPSAFQVFTITRMRLDPSGSFGLATNFRTYCESSMIIQPTGQAVFEIPTPPGQNGKI
jgi:hypothetical protein